MFESSRAKMIPRMVTAMAKVKNAADTCIALI